jgi:hypothetical protein
LGYARSTDTASTSAVTGGEGRTGVTSGQSSSDDHAAKRGFHLPADKLTLSATLASTLLLVPSSVCTAIIDPNWHHAMEEEFTALIASNTCDLVPHPVGSNIITNKWIFMHKFNPDSSLEQYKAR